MSKYYHDLPNNVLDLPMPAKQFFFYRVHSMLLGVQELEILRICKNKKSKQETYQIKYRLFCLVFAIFTQYKTQRLTKRRCCKDVQMRV